MEHCSGAFAFEEASSEVYNGTSICMLLHLSVSDVEQTLERVLASRSFARAEQLRRLLAYIVRTTLKGDFDSLKESVIGVDQYYQTEGTCYGLMISLEPAGIRHSCTKRCDEFYPSAHYSAPL